MNKKKLGQKIWNMAVKFRTKIESNDYKDFILGLVFYKFLSEKEEIFLKKNGLLEDEFKTLTEDNEELKVFCQKNLGYFIAYNNLFNFWLNKGKSFNVSDLVDGLNAFDRLIHPSQRKIYGGIFNVMNNNVSKLGENSSEQTKLLFNIINTIKLIPTDGKQKYDVLGYIYEYLIKNFAQSAGKKAGEFYTDPRSGEIIAKVVADYLQGRGNIKILDPTSGSGSLLINSGKIISSKLLPGSDIKYYAQELKTETYNISRMNLIMHNILPDNIEVRNADTLDRCWPFDDELNMPILMDAVIGNPPYSLIWDNIGKELDARFANYGVAPKSKADFAFVLDMLYLIELDGIVGVVLPHGVLFRGNEEAIIRKNLVLNKNIDAIVGLPGNMFFGTGIETIIMFLRKNKENSDILFVDASKEFVKNGNKNELRNQDVQKIVDTVIQRKNIDKYSRVVSLEEIEKNDYNLNISRYIDSSKNISYNDIFATINGGIPKSEISLLQKYFNEFDGLKEELFTESETPYVNIFSKDIRNTIINNKKVIDFKNKYNNVFDGFYEFLKSKLIDNVNNVNVVTEEEVIVKNFFDRLKNIPLIDVYNVYQKFSENYKDIISVDIENIQSDGFECTKLVDPNMVEQKKDGKDVEVQKGYVGRVIPFDLIYNSDLKLETNEIERCNNRIFEINSIYEEIIASLSDEEKDGDILNNDNTSFVLKEVEKELKSSYDIIETNEIKEIKEYINFLDSNPKKKEKVEFVENSSYIKWENIEIGKDGTYKKTDMQKYLTELQNNFEFAEDSYEFKIKNAYLLLIEEKALKIKKDNIIKEREEKTIKIINNLSDERVLELLEDKWIVPIMNSIYSVVDDFINDFIREIKFLENKYSETYNDIVQKNIESKDKICEMIGQLIGNEFDIKGLNDFKGFLGGE